MQSLWSCTTSLPHCGAVNSTPCMEYFSLCLLSFWMSQPVSPSLWHTFSFRVKTIAGGGVHLCVEGEAICCMILKLFCRYVFYYYYFLSITQRYRTSWKVQLQAVQVLSATDPPTHHPYQDSSKVSNAYLDMHCLQCSW